MRSKEDWQGTKSSVKERFKELLTLSQWTDCAFSVGDEGEVIRCHKLVLAVSSPVFEALFFGGLSDPQEVIRVPDMEPYIFRLLLKYMYSDSVEVESVGEAGGLLYASKKYLMPQLSRQCLEYLVDNTCIKTLWDMLHIAETLDEEQLLKSCLKVMCRYPYEVWFSQDEHLSGRTLLRLLDECFINMSEGELWQFVLSWSERECQLRGVECTDLNRRRVIEDCGLLGKIRFLVFTPREFEEGVEGCPLLTTAELSSIAEAISDLPTSSSLPRGFSHSLQKRFGASQVTWKCCREVISQGRAWISGGPIESRVSCSSRVLVTGFEVFTRFASISDIPKLRSSRTYEERLVLMVKDSSGEVLAKKEHSLVTEFNSLQEVSLRRPLWFSPRQVYTILIELPRAQYPLCTFADTSYAKGATFVFDDVVQLSSNVSFINSILYCL